MDDNRDDKQRRKLTSHGKKMIAVWSLVAVVGLGMFLFQGWGVVGSMVPTGNSTLSGMAEGKADGSGTITNPFDNSYSSGGYSGSTSGSSGSNKNGAPSAPSSSSQDAWSAPGFAPGAPAYDSAYDDGYGYGSGNTERYTAVSESGFKSVSTDPLSTFAADVDTASYANVRRMLLEGRRVDPSAVRVEEMINYFKYAYPDPLPGEPFSVTAEISGCPWNPDAQLLRVGMHAEDPVGIEDRLPSNFVFLLDVSGSMYDNLDLVKKAFNMLTENLDARDRISIVTYASRDEVLLEGATGEDGPRIRQIIGSLEAGGNTNGAAGIQTAYELARRYFIRGGINRVILATDGDLNVGASTPEELRAIVSEQAGSGITLSVLGFGWGNIKDDNMEALADNGDGNYYFIDGELEANRVLVEELGGTLNVVAKDVKFQVEFNPAYISSYRLVGYENREMAAQDFANDYVDGGEIGEGHRVTALYEIIPAGSGSGWLPDMRYQASGDGRDGELLTVSVRYKDPDGDASRLLTYPITANAVTETPTMDFRFAACVAEAGMLLRGSSYIGNITYRDILDQLSRIELDDVYKTEFVDLVERMQRLG